VRGVLWGYACLWVAGVRKRWLMVRVRSGGPVVEVNKGDTGVRRLRDEVGLRVRESAELEGRVVSRALTHLQDASGMEPLTPRALTCSGPSCTTSRV
jgi:hypothetical protein